ncbi:MAG TPA: uracil-DNA glycosylase [Chitinophagales bacterium]|nr:uracil-DNA glycosylase [Chitinophagales bacterium]
MDFSLIDALIEPSWKEVLQNEFQKKYFTDLHLFLGRERNSGKEIYPPSSLIFNAFNTTPFDEVKVVIIGQDPYHGSGQAHGLSFSVPDGISPPPSLKNIFKELHTDIGCSISTHGNLTKWAQQGVLLLNSMLTVEAHQPASHQKKGWEQFTDAVIQKISDKKTGVIFILWGKYAQQKGRLIDQQKHFVLQSAHPSPFSVTKFYGSKHFSQINQILLNQGQSAIDWQL